MGYEVKLEIFEGPLDLLLHLIHKNEVDIFDIPIATITDQYLQYLDLMKALNVDIAGDFLLMASTLIHIKSRMLLPAAEGDEEEEDPRVELTRPLLEYLRFKEAAESLAGREILDRDVFTRKTGVLWRGLLGDQEPDLDVSVFQLMEAFRRIVAQAAVESRLQYERHRWSVKEKTEAILARLREEGEIFFEALFDQQEDLSEIVVTFLALLELVHVGLVRVFQPNFQRDIRLTAAFEKNGKPEHG